MLGYDETIREVRRLYEGDPERYFYCDQYSNRNNPMAHYEDDGGGDPAAGAGPDSLRGGSGYGGTISGVGRRLKETNPDIQVCCITFDEWPGVEALKPLGEGHMVPDTFDESVGGPGLCLSTWTTGTRCRSCLASKGIFAGQSSGAYVQGAYEVAREVCKGTVVTILNDIGERYFSTRLWE